MLLKIILLLGLALVVTGLIQYVYFFVNMQLGANRFAFSLGLTALLAVPLLYHLFNGDLFRLDAWRVLLITYLPVAFLWFRLDLLKRTAAVQDDEDLL